MSETAKLLVKGVTILPMTGPSVLENKDVLISGSTIETIGHSATIKVDKGCQVIEGKGKYLLPGLQDMHTHLAQDENQLLFFLANGVTTIRNMSGIELHPALRTIKAFSTIKHLTMKKEIEAGTLEGPDIINGTPLLDGYPPIWSWPVCKVITNPRKVRKLVLNLKKKGFDFLKVYTNLSPAVFKEIIQVSREVSMKVAGHVPSRVGIEQAINMGIHSMEHLFGYLNPYSTLIRGFEEGTNEIKPEDHDRIIGLSVKKGTFNCPTLAVFEWSDNYKRYGRFKEMPWLKYINPKILKTQIKMCRKIAASPKLRVRCTLIKPERQAVMVNKLYHAGAPLVAGTDCGMYFGFPGFSLHSELELLEQAGLPREAVLKTATINAARLTGREDISGTVSEGKLADLLLLDANPLDNIKNTRKIAGVFRRGKWISGAEIQEKLDALESSYEEENRQNLADIERGPVD